MLALMPQHKSKGWKASETPVWRIKLEKRIIYHDSKNVLDQGTSVGQWMSNLIFVPYDCFHIMLAFHSICFPECLTLTGQPN